MTIIGISGKKRSGKNTVAEIIKLHREKSIVYAFADPLKMEVSRMTGFSVKYIDEHKDNFRLILQGWGADFRRKLFGEDFWLKKMDEAIETFNGNCDTLIIPDVRFINEYEWVKNKGGINIRVERGIDYSDNHISEIELDNQTFDIKIINDGTYEDLYHKVVDIIKNI